MQDAAGCLLVQESWILGDADARLIVAAPELLAALKEAVESLDSAEAESHAEYCSPQHSWRECGEGIRPQHLIARLEALIARVEGGK